MRRLVALVLLAVLLLSLPSAAYAAKPGGEQEALNNALVKGADLHLSREGTWSGIPNTWEWIIGTGAGYANVQGISATGLLAAYERTGKTAYLNGAIATGNTLVARYDAQPNNWDSRPYSQDIEFLVRLSADSGNPSYAAKAAIYYARITNNKTAMQNADRYIDARLSLAGWDLASQIRAAAAVGLTDYARGMTARLIERRAAWEGIPYGGWDYTTGSRASLLWAFLVIGQGDFKDYVTVTRSTLLGAQGANGSWDDGSYQTTAYAMLGLAQPRTPVVAQAVDRAWAFLRDSQTSAGGWTYTPEYGEEDSEVLMALGGLHLDEGKKIGHTDPQPARGNDAGKHKLDPLP